MTERVISATFSTWRPVHGRKVLQLVFEVPIEKQGDVLTMLGAPDDKWCAIALLKERPTPVDQLAEHRNLTPKVEGSNPSGRAKRKFTELSLPEQCGIRCEDAEFGQFLITEKGRHCQFTAAEYVRSYLGIDSRAKLSTDHDAANKWRKLNAEFESWQMAQRYPAEARR